MGEVQPGFFPLLLRILQGASISRTTAYDFFLSFRKKSFVSKEITFNDSSKPHPLVSSCHVNPQYLVSQVDSEITTSELNGFSTLPESLLKSSKNLLKETKENSLVKSMGSEIHDWGDGEFVSSPRTMPCYDIIRRVKDVSP